ncbi:hypothetical protein L6E12_34170 [Actinokineospora sp. PR83]|uniref:hypothetical protein n=1 Tax=Actinokineospora sp. PR83 TaxID=2884908 RepID=UPI001F2971AD|nr:hypothetical protein [Actinokineospora sp. PR83]MCG8920813.1 hypothetical protein [Actinokineospora sp. PR83]
MATKRWRHLLVWLHVLTSVGWMAQALGLFVLLSVSETTDDPAVRVAATTMAEKLDLALLAPMANASAMTGVVLAAATSWGFFRHWWVAAKFAITLIQLYIGIFVLSGKLHAAVDAAAAGTPAPPALLVGPALMAGAIAFQAWLSVAKPRGRVPGGRGAAPGTAPTWVFVLACAVVPADIAIATVLGNPMPLLSLVTVMVAVGRRAAASSVDPVAPAPA